MKKLIQTLVLILAAQMVFAQFPCQSAFTYNYDGQNFLYLNDLSFNVDSTMINVVNWNWTVGVSNPMGGTTNFTATGANPAVAIGLNPGWAVVCLQITTAGGCSSTTCDTINLGGTPTNACQAAFTYNYDGQNLLYLNDLSYNTDSTAINVSNYTWTVSGGGLVLTGTGANPILPVGLNPGWVMVCLQITTATGCTSTACDTLSLGGNPTSCQADFSYSSGGFFNPLLFQFTDLSTSGSPAIPVNSWYWEITNTSGNTLFTSSIQNPSFTFPGQGYYNVCLSIMADSTCFDTFCQNVYVMDSTMNNCYIEVVPEIYNVSVIGASDGLIDLTITGGSTPYSFAWNNGAASEDISGLEAGVYTVAISQSNPACPVQSYTFQIMEPYQTTPIDTLFTTAIDSCLGFVVDTFYVSGIVIVGNTVNVSWVFQGGGLSASFVMSYSFNAYGPYMVALSFNCTKSLTNFMTYINVSQHLGIEKPESNTILLYPNPGSGHTNLILPSETGQARLHVFNSTGSLIYSAKLNQGNQGIDVSSWTPGLYFIRVEGQNGKQFSTQFVRQ